MDKELNGNEKNTEEELEIEITERLIINGNEANDKKRKLKIIGAIGAVILVVGIFIGVHQMMKNNAVQKQLELGQDFMEESNYEEARLAFDEAIEIDPKSVKAYLKKAETYIMEDEYDEAEELINTAQSIKQTNYGNLLLCEVYYQTSRIEAGEELAEGIVQNDDLDSETYDKAVDVLKGQRNYESLEMLYENSLTDTKDSNELVEIYQNLIETYLVSGKSVDEVNALTQQAQEAVGTEKMQIENGDETTIQEIENELNEVYCPFYEGTPDDFATIEDLDLKWFIYKAIVESNRNNYPEHSQIDIEGSKSTNNFLSLDAIRNYGQSIINPDIVVPDNSSVYDWTYNDRVNWDSTLQGFVWENLSNYSVSETIDVKNAVKVDDLYYVEATELVFSYNSKYDFALPGETLYVSCNGQQVGTAIVTSSGYDFSFTTDDITTWTYVLQENPEGRYFIKSKMINA